MGTPPLLSHIQPRKPMLGYPPLCLIQSLFIDAKSGPGDFLGLPSGRIPALANAGSDPVASDSRVQNTLESVHLFLLPKDSSQRTSTPRSCPPSGLHNLFTTVRICRWLWPFLRGSTSCHLAEGLVRRGRELRVCGGRASLSRCFARPAEVPWHG